MASMWMARGIGMKSYKSAEIYLMVISLNDLTEIKQILKYKVSSSMQQRKELKLW